MLFMDDIDYFTLNFNFLLFNLLQSILIDLHKSHQQKLLPKPVYFNCKVIY